MYFAHNQPFLTFVECLRIEIFIYLTKYGVCHIINVISYESEGCHWPRSSTVKVILNNIEAAQLSQFHIAPFLMLDDKCSMLEESSLTLSLWKIIVIQPLSLFLLTSSPIYSSIYVLHHKVCVSVPSGVGPPHSLTTSASTFQRKPSTLTSNPWSTSPPPIFM